MTSPLPLLLPAAPATGSSARSAWGIAAAWTALIATLGALVMGARIENYREIVLNAAGVRLTAVKDTVSISFGQWSALPRSIARNPDVAAFQYVALGGSVADVARELPSLFRGRGVHRPADWSGLGAALELFGEGPLPLMVDGDFFTAPSGRVRVRVGPPVTFLLP